MIGLDVFCGVTRVGEDFDRMSDDEAAHAPAGWDAPAPMTKEEQAHAPSEWQAPAPTYDKMTKDEEAHAPADWGSTNEKATRTETAEDVPSPKKSPQSTYTPSASTRPTFGAPDAKPDAPKKSNDTPSNAKSSSTNYGAIFSTLADLTDGASAHAKGEAAASASAEAIERATAAAIYADAEATAAVSRAGMAADLAKGSKDPHLLAPVKPLFAAASRAIEAQNVAGAAPEIDRVRRVIAAQRVVDSAPNAIVRAAAKRTLAKAVGSGVGPGAKGAKHVADSDADEGMLARKLFGPVRVWHALVGALTAVGVAILWRTFPK